MKYNDNNNWLPTNGCYGFTSSRKINRERKDYFKSIKKSASVPFVYLLSECFNENHIKSYYILRHLFKELYKESTVDIILKEVNKYSIISEIEKNSFKRKYIVYKLLKYNTRDSVE